MTTVLTERELRQAVTLDLDSLAAIENAFTRLARGEAGAPRRRARPGMDDVDRVIGDESVDRAHRSPEREWVLRLLDDRMREFTPLQFLLELVAADVCVMSLDARVAQRTNLRECRRRGSRPAVPGREVKDSHVLV